MASWSVVSTVAEPSNLLCAFVAHYLSLGAEEVHLFLDDPTHSEVAPLRRMKGVRLTRCTRRYWRWHHKGRPPGQVMRQLFNANRAYRACHSEWFFFCDADEFLTAAHPVSDLLEAVDPDILYCRPQMAERVFPEAQAHLFDGPLRLPLERPAVLRHVYGELADMTTHGLSGHVLGKSFVRTRRADLRIRLHFPVPFNLEEEARQKVENRLKPGPFLPDSWLVHFDGMTLLHWRLKLLRYYLDYAPQFNVGDRGVFKGRTAARSAQLNAVYHAGGDGAQLARLLPLVQPTPDMLALLEEAGGLLKRNVDPGATAHTHFGPDLCFSPDDFDASLRMRHGPVMAEHGLL